MAKKKKIQKKVAEKNPNKTVETQFFWLVGIVIVIILAFIFVPVLYHQIFEKFEYAGVKFEKMKQGQITFYHGQFPIIYKGNFTAVYNVYLRNDPRYNTIPINTNVTLSKRVYVSLNEGAERCEDMVLGQSELGKFFGAFPFIVKNVSAAVYDTESAKLYNMTQITCANASADKTVFVVQKSDNPSIEKGDTDNCYILNVGNCEYLETVERFIIGTMAQVNERPLE